MNKYNSLSDVFIGADLYNLTFPVLPPANLSIGPTEFAPTYMFNRMGATSQVVGFNKRDKPYIRGLGFFSNVADGLVDASPAHFGATSWRMTYQLERFAAALTGSISNTAGSATVSGVATLFTTELSVGSIIVWLDGNSCVRSGTVDAIASDISLTLTATSENSGMLTANTAAKFAYPRIGNAGGSVTVPFLTLNTLYPQSFYLGDVSGIYPPRGTVTATSGSAALVGVGTYFTVDYAVGMPIVFGTGSNRRVYVISAITDDTHITLTANASLSQSGVALVEYDDHLRVKCSITSTFAAYTISIDPAFSTGSARLSLHAMAEIEHSYSLAEGIY